MTTKKRKAIIACAMNLMYSYDDWLDAEYEDECNDAKREYDWRLHYLSELTGISQYILASALGKRDGYTYDLEWLRDLGVEI